MSEVDAIEPRQARAARALLGWSEAKLAQMSRLSLDTIRRIECEQDIEKARPALAMMRRAFEAAGVIFLAGSDFVAGGSGVRLKR